MRLAAILRAAQYVEKVVVRSPDCRERVQTVPPSAIRAALRDYNREVESFPSTVEPHGVRWRRGSTDDQEWATYDHQGRMYEIFKWVGPDRLVACRNGKMRCLGNNEYPV